MIVQGLKAQFSQVFNIFVKMYYLISPSKFSFLVLEFSLFLLQILHSSIIIHTVRKKKKKAAVMSWTTSRKVGLQLPWLYQD